METYEKVKDFVCKQTPTTLALAGSAALAVAGASCLLLRPSVPVGPVVEKIAYGTDEELEHGGFLVARVLKNHNVKFLFTLCGGHISPILVGSKALGIQVVDVRHEVNASFAADAISRVTGTVGAFAVTAGPGLSNTITAVKNAQMAQSPLLILGGATSDILKGRASLQDIDQFALFKPHCKFMAHITSVTDIAPTLEKAFYYAQEGVPGPVFVEFPVDVLYPKKFILSTFDKMRPPRNSLMGKVISAYVDYHGRRVFGTGPVEVTFHKPVARQVPQASSRQVNSIVSLLKKSAKPVMIIGSQAAMQGPEVASKLAEAVLQLGIPVYLSGMGRGLLGRNNDLQKRHYRKEALKKSDLVLLVGVPMDFRLEYGQGIPRRVKIVSVNLSKEDLYLNRWPDYPIHADPSGFLLSLAASAPAGLGDKWKPWNEELKQNEEKREKEIAAQAAVVPPTLINPVHFCRKLEEHIGDDAVLIGDGGDFVATCAYTIKPRGPLGWLDPGPYGTLGIGLGMAIGAKLHRPKSEIWLLFGDGAAGYSLMEFDTIARHNIPVIVVIGNDACWRQIERDQVDVLKDDVGCVLAFTHYDQVAKALGAEGFTIETAEEIDDVLKKARELYAQGKSVLINAKISKADFRKGSISV